MVAGFPVSMVTCCWLGLALVDGCLKAWPDHIPGRHSMSMGSVGSLRIHHYFQKGFEPPHHWSIVIHAMKNAWPCKAPPHPSPRVSPLPGSAAHCSAIQRYSTAFHGLGSKTAWHGSMAWQFRSTSRPPVADESGFGFHPDASREHRTA